LGYILEENEVALEFGALSTTTDPHPLRRFGVLGGLREKPLQHKGKLLRQEDRQLAHFERDTKAAKLSKDAIEGCHPWRSN